MFREKRKHKRSMIAVPLKGQLMRKDKRVTLTEQISIISRDISLGGMRLKWPKEWECKKCTNCLGWVFNFGCRFKKNSAYAVNRALDSEVIFKMILATKETKPQEVMARIVWAEKPGSDDTYDVGLNFIKVNKELEEGVTSLIRKDGEE